MRRSFVVKALVAVVIAGHGAAASASAAELPAPARLEVDGLLTALGTSDCRFYRNGQWYGGMEAQEHLRMKYDYLKGRLSSTEEFIKEAATQSSLSGEPYQVKCPNQPAQPSAVWLGERLRERRTARQDTRS